MQGSKEGQGVKLGINNAAIFSYSKEVICLR